MVRAKRPTKQGKRPAWWASCLYNFVFHFWASRNPELSYNLAMEKFVEQPQATTEAPQPESRAEKMKTAEEKVATMFIKAWAEQ